MTCCVIDSLVDNNLLEQLALTGADYQQRFVFARQPDVDLAHFIRENLPSFRSRFARQVSDVINGMRDFLHTRVGDHRCVSKWYTTYVGDRFSEVMTQVTYAT